MHKRYLCRVIVVFSLGCSRLALAWKGTANQEVVAYA